MLLHNTSCRTGLCYTARPMSGSLYLFPKDPWSTPPATALVLTTLRELTLVDQMHGQNSWLAGNGLLRHITFAGCSPHLEFTPPADGGNDFCHLSLLGPFELPRLFTGPNTLNPRCPACKSRVPDWRPLAETFRRDPCEPWHCPACGAEQGIDSLRWRHHAACGRLLVEIHSVFPAEGMPSDELLEALEQASGMPWDYGWAASST
jgi:hypothetical protein